MEFKFAVKKRLSQKIWKLWTLHKDQTVCFFPEKVARYEIKHEKTPNSRLYVYAYIKNPVFLKSVIIYQILLVFTGLEVCLSRMVTHSKGLAQAKTAIGSPVPTDLYHTISYPARDQTVPWRVCMGRGMWEFVWIWNSNATFQNYVFCLPIFEKLQLNYLSVVHLLSFLRF